MASGIAIACFVVVEALMEVQAGYQETFPPIRDKTGGRAVLLTTSQAAEHGTSWI